MVLKSHINRYEREKKYKKREGEGTYIQIQYVIRPKVDEIQVKGYEFQDKDTIIIMPEPEYNDILNNINEQQNTINHQKEFFNDKVEGLENEVKGLQTALNKADSDRRFFEKKDVKNLKTINELEKRIVELENNSFWNRLKNLVKPDKKQITGKVDNNGS